MSGQTTQKQQYMISVYESEESDETLIFTFVPKGLPYETENTGVLMPRSQFIVSVREEPGGLTYEWPESSDDPGAAVDEIQEEIAVRMKDRKDWIDRVTDLVNLVEEWARELNWSTRFVEKKLDDMRIGKHRVPALVMQEDTCRVLLEPVGRATPGTEGVVDLYLMPAYDDIASLFYYENRWNLHCMFPGTESVAEVRDAKALPLSKQALEKVLLEMKQNAT